MPAYEVTTLLTFFDENGNKYYIYPIVRSEDIVGLEDRLRELEENLSIKLVMKYLPETYSLDLTLQNEKGQTIGNASASLPLGEMVTKVEFFERNQMDGGNALKVSLKNGTSSLIPISKIIEGLVTKGELDAVKSELNSSINQAKLEAGNNLSQAKAELEKEISSLRGSSSNSLAELEGKVKSLEGNLEEKASNDDLSSLQTIVEQKANTTYVNAELAKKADITYVDTELSKKADKATVTEEIDKAIKGILGEGEVNQAYDTLKEIADWIDEHGTVASSLISKVSTLEGKATTFEGDIKSIKEKNSNQDSRLTNLETTAESLGQSIENLTNEDTKIRGEINSLRTQVNSDIDGLRTKISNLLGQEGNDGKSLSEIVKELVEKQVGEEVVSKEDFENFKTEMGGKASLEYVEQQLNTIRTNLTTISGDLDPIKEKIAEIEERAERNKINEIRVNGSPLEVKDPSDSRWVELDGSVVTLQGNQTITGVKTFVASPKVPSKSSAPSSEGTTILATERQVYDVDQKAEKAQTSAGSAKDRADEAYALAETKYSKSKTGIPLDDLSQEVQDLINNAQPPEGEGAVTGIRGEAETPSTKYRTGNVTITKAHLGLENVKNEEQATKVEFDELEKRVGALENLGVHVGSFDTAADLPKTTTALPGVTVNDFATVKSDSTHDNLPCRYIIKSISGTTITWEHDLTYSVDITGKVDKVDGKGLSTNDFTTVLKNKLEAIDPQANNYVLPPAKKTTLGGIKLFSETVQSEVVSKTYSMSDRTYAVQLNSSGEAVVNVPWERGEYTLPEASADRLGGVKLASNTKINGEIQPILSLPQNGRTYGVVTNSDGRLVVNVPWEGSSYDTFSADEPGLVPAVGREKAVPGACWLSPMREWKTIKKKGTMNQVGADDTGYVYYENGELFVWSFSSATSENTASESKSGFFNKDDYVKRFKKIVVALMGSTNTVDPFLAKVYGEDPNSGEAYETVDHQIKLNPYPSLQNPDYHFVRITPETFGGKGNVATDIYFPHVRLFLREGDSIEEISSKILYNVESGGTKGCVEIRSNTNFNGTGSVIYAVFED